jgi:hypothetical protein
MVGAHRPLRYGQHPPKYGPNESAYFIISNRARMRACNNFEPTLQLLAAIDKGSQ